MTGPDPTSAEAVALLHGAQPEPSPDALTEGRPPLLSRVVARGRRSAVRAARRGLAPVSRWVAAEAEPRLNRVVQDALHADPSLSLVRDLTARGAFDPERWKHRDDDLHAAQVNLTLLKGELRHMQAILDELGMAFAPATGLAGAGARFAELRETVYGLERRLRNAPAVAAAPGDTTPLDATPGNAAPTVPPAEAGSSDRREAVLSSTLFDYVGFERRFRGDPDQILGALVERYGELLSGHQPVVDIGCGRGELLGRLAEQGVEVIGIEPDPGMAEEARSRGITVHDKLAGEWLRSVPDGSLGSIITTHVLEHLQLDDMIEVLELSVRKLRPDGVFVSETPNPASLIVLGNSYLLDPTHVRPLHPSLLAFLSEKAGFRDVRLQFFSPASGYHLPLVHLEDGENVPAWARLLADSLNEGFGRLNEVIFGPQDYAVIARTAPADG